MELYFAYGSNLSIEQMTARCPSATVCSRAVLHGYRLCFLRTQSSWHGGVASLAESPGAAVEGVIYRLTPEDLSRLDRYENVDGGSYFRQRLELEMPDGRAETAWVYIARPIEDGPCTPSRRYFMTILIGALENGLSASHISAIVSAAGPHDDAAGSDQDE